MALFSHLFEYNKFGANRFGNVHLEEEQLNFSTDRLNIIRKLRHYINLLIVTKSLYNKKDML